MRHPKLALVVAAGLAGSLGCAGNEPTPARTPAADGSRTTQRESDAPRAVAVGDHPPAIAVRSIEGVELIKLQEMYQIASELDSLTHGSDR
jgi:hypothetical protein